MIASTDYLPIHARVHAAILTALGYAPHTRGQLRVYLIAAGIYGCASVLDAALAELLQGGKITVAGQIGEETYFLAQKETL